MDFITKSILPISIAATAMGMAVEMGYDSNNIKVAISVPCLIALIKIYFDGGSYDGKERIDGKTVLITGANTGIGKETAKELAKRGGRIILACRDVSKSEQAKLEIIQETGNTQIESWYLDLASLQSIREFAKKFDEEEDRLDILINNAGVMYCSKSCTVDGLETQMATNHFGHFLLTNLLLDKIKACSPSRIIILSSGAHFRGKIKWDDINSNQTYSRTQVYSMSKLANILHCRELSKRLKGSGVTVNCLHPGIVRTEIMRHIGMRYFISRVLLAPILLLMFKSGKQGAQTTLRLALDPSLNEVSGQYFSDCEIQPPSSYAQNDDDARRLWELSEMVVSEHTAASHH